METAVALVVANDDDLIWDLLGLVIAIPVGIVILLIMCVVIVFYLISIVVVFSIIMGIMNLVVSLVTGIGIHEMAGLYVVIDVIAVVAMVQHIYYRNTTVTVQSDTDSDENESDADDDYIAESEDEE